MELEPEGTNEDLLITNKLTKKLKVALEFRPTQGFEFQPTQG